MKNTALQQRLSDEILSFIGGRRSLQLATLGEDGAPFASYAPFAFDENSLYVLLSDIAIHGVNLMRDARGSVLIIEDEDSAGELFARIRVNYQVAAEELEVDSASWKRGVELLVERHGERPNKLSQLADFRLFKLSPLQGRYVKGFGKAYSLAGGSLTAESIDHLRDGHRPRAEVQSTSGQAAENGQEKVQEKEIAA